MMTAKMMFVRFLSLGATNLGADAPEAPVAKCARLLVVPNELMVDLLKDMLHVFRTNRK